MPGKIRVRPYLQRRERAGEILEIHAKTPRAAVNRAKRDYGLRDWKILGVKLHYRTDRNWLRVRRYDVAIRRKKVR